jgi:hypothetical protein
MGRNLSANRHPRAIFVRFSSWVSKEHQEGRHLDANEVDENNSRQQIL